MQHDPRDQKQLPNRVPIDPARRHGTQIQVQFKGPIGCLAGAVMLAVALVVLVIVVVTGIIALAAAAWIAAALLALGIVAALLRRR